MTNAIGPVGTTALTVVALIWRRDGSIASTANAWAAFSTGLSWPTYVRSTTEFGATGNYNLVIHADLQKDWWFVSFHDGTTPGATLASLTEAIAICENPSITDATIPAGTMLRRTVGRFGGATPTRNATTGLKTFKDADGNTVYTETPTNTEATRVLS